MFSPPSAYMFTPEEMEDDPFDPEDLLPALLPLVPVQLPLLVEITFELVKHGTVQQVGAMLDQGVAVDARDVNRETLLMHACIRGRRAMAAYLLSRGAVVNLNNDAGHSAAIAASYNGHVNTMKLLVTWGADVHVKSRRGSSSLLRAALRDRLPLCEYLLSLGADLRVANDAKQTATTHYGDWATPIPCPETKALRVAALEAWWAAGPHPSQVQRRRDECWFRRGPLLWVLAEHAYRPLLERALAIALAAAELDPAEAVVVQTSRMQDVLRTEGLVRYVVSFL